MQNKNQYKNYLERNYIGNNNKNNIKNYNDDRNKYKNNLEKSFIGSNKKKNIEYKSVSMVYY